MRKQLSSATLAIDCRLGSGIRTIVRNLVPRIARQVKQLILLDRKDPRGVWGIEAQNVDYVRFDAVPYGAVEQYGFPWKILRRVDLLHVPHYNVPLLWPKPLVVTLNDLTQFTPEFRASPLDQTIAQSLISWVLWRANEILTLSHYTRSNFIKRFGRKASRLRVYYPGVDLTTFRPIDRSAALSQVQREFAIDGPYILTVGSVRPNKNISGLLQAFAITKQQFALKQRLVIVGERNGFLTSTDISIPRGLETEVSFTGHVSDSALPVLYAGAEAFVFASLHEGFGIPPLEAMACGIPTIVSNRASIPEVVGDASILVDPNDASQFARAIFDVISDGQLRKGLIEAGQRRAGRFSWESTAECYLEAYGRALA
jgi:glycosyltransferase involved in cell wall biosynthesis